MKVGMKNLSAIPPEDREHFMKCPVCESYFDMRDLTQVVAHQHWPEPAPVSFTHSVKLGKEDEVHLPTKRGMITLRYKKQKHN